MKEIELQIDNVKIIEDVLIKYQGKANDLHKLIISILSEFMENVKKTSFGSDFWDFQKLLTLNKTFFPNGILFEDTLNRFYFRKNGMARNISKFQKKALLIDIFIHKGQIDKVLRTPYLHEKDSQINLSYRINQKIICSVIYIAFQRYINKTCPTIKFSQKSSNSPYNFKEDLLESCKFSECINFKTIDSLIMPKFRSESSKKIYFQKTTNKCIFEDLLEEKDLAAYFMDKNRVDQQDNQVYNITETLQNYVDEHDFSQTEKLFPVFPEKIIYDNNMGKIYLNRVQNVIL